ncbi:hypothetical protein EJD97_009487 [Solanum chilense]|uniref:Uncharacterized protein n=1 Tax=Solanum chilense TaxID=4083 RepID=A0A6N2BMG1_SOLCI|nr:hypothetical protein EJD97_009487 [Solanum chilense]
MVNLINKSTTFCKILLFLVGTLYQDTQAGETLILKIFSTFLLTGLSLRCTPNRFLSWVVVLFGSHISIYVGATRASQPAYPIVHVH